MIFVAPLNVDDDVWTDPDPSGGLTIETAWARPVMVLDRDDEPCLMAVPPPGSGAQFDCSVCGWNASMHITWHGGKAIMSGDIADSLHGRVERPDLAVSEPAWTPTLNDTRAQIERATAALAAGVDLSGTPLTDETRKVLTEIANPPAWAAGVIEHVGYIGATQIVESAAVPPDHIYAGDAGAITGAIIDVALPDGPTDAQLAEHAAQAAPPNEMAAVPFASDVYTQIAEIDKQLRTPSTNGRCVNCRAMGHADCGSRARGTLRHRIDLLSRTPNVGGATLKLVDGETSSNTVAMVLPPNEIIVGVPRSIAGPAYAIEPAVFAPVAFSAPIIVDKDGAVVPPKLAAKRQRFMDAVRAYCEADPRTLQTAIGPSEIGDPCDARVLRRALGMKGGAIVDPWASFVGTATHIALAKVFEAVNATLDRPRYLLEQRVHMNAAVSGSTDLADVIEWREVSTDGTAGVVDIYDHKVLGTDSFRQAKTDKLSPESKYGVQIDEYALGWRNAGFEVRTVNLALWPRSGFLDGLLIIERAPDYANAEAALVRVERLVAEAVGNGATEYDEPWQDGTISTTPGKGCGFCPFYAPNLPLGKDHCDKGREFMAANKRGTGPRGVTP